MFRTLCNCVSREIPTTTVTNVPITLNSLLLHCILYINSNIVIAVEHIHDIYLYPQQLPHLKVQD